MFPLFALAAVCFPAVALGRPQNSTSGKASPWSQEQYPGKTRSYIHYAQAQTYDSVKSINYPGDYVAAADKFANIIFPQLTFYRADDSYESSNGVAHVYFWPQVGENENKAIAFNVHLNVNVKDGKIFSFGGHLHILESMNNDKAKIPSLVTVQTSSSSKVVENPPTKRDISDPMDALKTAINALKLNFTTDEVKAEAVKDAKHSYVYTGTGGSFVKATAQIGYFFTGDNSLPLARCWKIDIDIWPDKLVIYIDVADPNKVHGKSSLAFHYMATSEVYPWGVADPAHGECKVIGDPWNLEASPFTWQGQGRGGYEHTTRGNNVIAGMDLNYPRTKKNRYPTYFPAAASGRRFEYPYSNYSLPKDYRDASITQAFYTINMYHDLLYTLGFDEKAGNFQANNNGQGGKENDPVIVLVQHYSGSNNAYFITAADGESPRIFLYLHHNRSGEASRDPSFDATVLVHDILPSDWWTSQQLLSSSLYEEYGMGEGWSDFMALAIRVKPTDNRNTQYEHAAWTLGLVGLSRSAPYTTNKTINWMAYGNALKVAEIIHQGGRKAIHLPYWIGETWANALLEVLWNLIEKHGITDALIPRFDSRGVPTDGRYLTMKLVMHAMMLQPCHPDMVDARDAVLDADIALTGGENQCEIWRGFAERGLGNGAYLFQGSQEVPDGVCPEQAKEGQVGESE